MNRILFPMVSRLLRRTINNSLHTASPRPDAPLYAVRGVYPVGTREFKIKDRKRPLKLTIWYPVLKPDDTEEVTTYVEGPVKFMGQALKNADASREDAPFPLVIFSHGSGGTRLQSLFLTEHLASHGFVVMAVGHPGNTVFDGILSPDKYEENRLRNYVSRPDDILRQIEFARMLSDSDGKMAGVIDAENVAVMGHSFGGYTALAAGGACLNFDALNEWCADPVNAELDDRALGSVCYLRHHVELFAELHNLDRIPDGSWPSTTDPCIKAVVAMAPWNAPLFGVEGLASVTVPTLVVVGSKDPVTIPERDAYAVYEHIKSSSKALFILENAGHFIFVDSCTEIHYHFNMFEVCSDKVWDMVRAHDLINHVTTAFLRSTFYNDVDAAQALSKGAIDFSSVRYKTSGF